MAKDITTDVASEDITCRTSHDLTIRKIRKDTITDLTKQIYDWLKQQDPKDYADFHLTFVDAKDYQDFAVKITHLVQSQDIALNDGRVPTTYYLIRKSGQIIGLAKTRLLLNGRTAHEGGHIRLAIEPAYREQGFGGFVLDHLMSELKSHGVKDIMLSTYTDNYAARRLIQATGGFEESLGESWNNPTKTVIRYWIHF